MPYDFTNNDAYANGGSTTPPLSWPNTGTVTPTGNSFVANDSSPFVVPAPGGLPPMGNFTFACNYTSKLNSGNVTAVLSPVGYTPFAQEENHPSFGKYTRVQMALDIPTVLLNGLTPKPGDFFVGPDSYTYNVLKRQTNSLFFCRIVGWCPKLSLSLTDTVQYKQATCAGSSSTGARTVTHTNVGSTVTAAIQPMTASLAEMYGTKAFPDHYIIYLAGDPSGTGYTVMQAGDLFVDQNNIAYEIQSVYERNRLDFLPAFECVKKL